MGGDHKCPLCSATFTRPQHVGRHLRAHTGDRPYECKECPLRFARSDLLSRHVNKAHKAPDENGRPPAGKKGRRKSMPSSAHPAHPTPHGMSGGDPSGSAHKPRRASFNPSSAMGYSSADYGPSEYSPAPSQAIPASTAPAPQHPPLQAQSMYPHHPLLAGTPQPSSQNWTSSPPMDMGPVVSPNFASPYYPGYSPVVSNGNGMGQTMAPNGLAPSFQPPFTAVPMRLSGSEQEYMTASPMGRNSSAGSLNSLGYEFGFKKRACDQCNHSKVRCDFAEPCHRCAHRNLRCSYNKPQKSRTIATIPTQRMSLPNAGPNTTSASSYSASSYSPQSHSSSPHSNSSPLNSTMPPPSLPNHHITNPLAHSQQQPQTALPSGMVDPNSYAQTQAWSQSQWHPMTAPPMDQALGLTQQSQTLSQSPRDMAPSSTSSQYSQLPMPLPRADSGSSSGISPRAHLAATPSLTNYSHSTSPESEVPAERRSSSFNSTTWSNGDYLKGKSAEPMVAPDAYVTGISPTTATTTAGSIYPADTNTFAWAPPVTATIDPRFQFRNSLTGEEDSETVSRPPSSAASTFYEGTLDEASLAALNQRRRSSAGTGLWASAFNQMSLQDGGIGGTIDPYTASQVAQARRPSYPVIHPTIPEGSSYNGSYSSNSGKIPSLGDVKDLWKQFMSEPMTGGMGPTANGEQIDPMSATMSANVGYGNAQTPVRPAMGSRGLSKSNSMPDLTSPLANAQPFFSTYNNGATPRPAVPQASYTHNQPLADGNEVRVETDGEGNAVVMRRWKDSIKNRQASFEFDSNAHAKIKATSPPTLTSSLSPPSVSSQASSTATATPSQSAVTGVPSINFNPNRPRASVLQNPALQQTLAPERVPSFGLPSFGVDNLPTPSGKTTFRANAAKFSSALARPGNKRLASQTLVPSDQTKKTSGEVIEGWHDLDGATDAEAIGAEFVMPGGLVGMPGSTGMTPIGSGPGGPAQYFGWNNAPGMGLGGTMGMGVGVGVTSNLARGPSQGM